ncbi:hypothetical protein JQ506_02525 [Shinella sp. PSBB067]|uniref:hypothetical protein n=1 Tax=Shinella sp. PSBB067 TaxID=2715959 RepID=UPI00193C437D|nr:hypothetical protein [Shinella sp. PSBB067]QRI63908.1 hypothetical protein JQ506_02525 [Shinella sp. PSBB067]
MNAAPATGGDALRVCIDDAGSEKPVAASDRSCPKKYHSPIFDVSSEENPISAPEFHLSICAPLCNFQKTYTKRRNLL